MYLTLYFLFSCFSQMCQISLVAALLVASWSSFRAGELGDSFQMTLNQEICFKFAVFYSY